MLCVTRDKERHIILELIKDTIADDNEEPAKKSFIKNANKYTKKINICYTKVVDYDTIYWGN